MKAIQFSETMMSIYQTTRYKTNTIFILECMWASNRIFRPPGTTAPLWARAFSISSLHDHTRHTSLDRTPLDEY